jgi:hypothetical protein
MSKRIPTFLALAAGAFVAIPAAQAGPTVLRDDQLRDVAVTPVLGRGYSLATNTFQSTCLQDIVRTKPSYDFHYKFEQIDESGKKTSNTSTSGSGSAQGGFFGISYKFSASGSKSVIDGETWTSQRLVVTTDVDVYYSSVDESKSKIADPARELLTNNDLPGFFDSCGMYYARSIGRKAQFSSLFTYKTKSTNRDTAFEAKLEAELKGWGQSGSFSVQRSSKFSEEASSKQLTIESTALGLGKDEKATLIAWDLDTFKAAIKDAFLSMQQEDTGKVTSMEVVPWIENADFQRILKLKETTPDKDGKTVSPYAQKRILNQNGEFLAEVDRVARAKLNVYYKAKQCRQQIDLDYKDQDGNFRPLWKDSKVVNYRSGQTIPLSELDSSVAQTNIEKLFEEYRNFLFGSDPNNSDKSGVACVRDLLASGLTTQSYRLIPSCQAVEQQFGTISGRLVDEYCMPRVE